MSPNPSSPSITELSQLREQEPACGAISIMLIEILEKVAEDDDQLYARLGIGTGAVHVSALIHTLYQAEGLASAQAGLGVFLEHLSALLRDFGHNVDFVSRWNTEKEPT